MARGKKAITIQDVARAAGVSVSTVSRVLNDKDDVAAETYERVRAVIQEMGYTSSLAARSMRSRRTNVIGLIIPDVADSFSIQVMKGVNEAIFDLDYDLIIYTSGSIKKRRAAEREQYFVSLLNGSIADGVIIVTPAATNFSTAAPVVTIDPNSECPECLTVIAENYAGAMAAMEYLIDLGHRRIGFIGGRPDLQCAQQRLQGYQDALRQANLPLDPDLVATGDFSIETSRLCARELLSLSNRPTAIFAANDQSAMGAIETAGQMGLRVPDDLSVAGFDNIPEATYFNPVVTTVDQFIDQMGRVAAEKLIDMIQGESLESDVYRMPTQLVYAQGCGLVDGAPPLEIVPTAHLRPGAGAGATGLTAAYYPNAAHEGQPALIQLDRTVDFIWKDTTPLTGQWGDEFSILWTGYLVPPASGRYRLGVDACSGYKLYVDGELLVECESVHHPALRSREVALEGGRYYPLRLEFFSHGLDPQARLLWARPDIDYETPGLEAAGRADVIVAVMGISPRLEGEEMPVKVDGFEGGDRTSIDLPPLQEGFLKKLHGLGKPIVLVLLNGSALAVTWAAEHIPAIVEAWYPGQAGGEALADVLFGDYNPGGRLPVTFYRSTADLPPFDDYDMAGRTYRYFRGEPLYPFGHGLSYTTFDLGDLRIEPALATIGGQVVVSASVTNTGQRAGGEVVQIYIRHLDAAVPRPIKELKGFTRIHLEPGERRTVTFTLHTHQLGYYDAAMRYAVHPGTVEVLVGRSSQDQPLAGRFEIVGERAPVDKVFFSHASVE